MLSIDESHIMIHFIPIAPILVVALVMDGNDVCMMVMVTDDERARDEISNEMVNNVPTNALLEGDTIFVIEGINKSIITFVDDRDTTLLPIHISLSFDVVFVYSLAIGYTWIACMYHMVYMRRVFVPARSLYDT